MIRISLLCSRQAKLLAKTGSAQAGKSIEFDSPPPRGSTLFRILCAMQRRKIFPLLVGFRYDQQGLEGAVWKIGTVRSGESWADTEIQEELLTPHEQKPMVAG